MKLVSKQIASPFAWSESDGACFLEAELSGARAVFSTRLGGVSESPYDRLNLGILTDDDPARVARNFDLLAAALARPSGSIAVGRQVHGTNAEVHRAVPGGLSKSLVEADIQISVSSAATPLVLAADCLPVAIAASGAVAMVHCGWRGVASGVVEVAAQTLRTFSNGDRSDLEAVIGPGIGPCCYEVGRDVVDAFGARGHDVGRMLDLGAIVRVELERCGVRAERVATSGLCTSCNPELFYSYRRDGPATGRQAGLVWLTT